jgi:small subunit ribosomal protein S16
MPLTLVSCPTKPHRGIYEDAIHMVRIRLRRVGKRKQPVYRVVVADSHSPRDGRFIEIIGQYAPLTNPSQITIDTEKALDWLRKGAKPSESVTALLKRTGIWSTFVADKGPPPKPPKRKKAAAKREAEEKAAAKAAKPAEPPAAPAAAAAEPPAPAPAEAPAEPAPEPQAETAEPDATGEPEPEKTETEEA